MWLFLSRGEGTHQFLKQHLLVSETGYSYCLYYTQISWLYLVTKVGAKLIIVVAHNLWRDNPVHRKWGASGIRPIESISPSAWIQPQICFMLISSLLLYATLIQAGIIVKSFQDFFYYQKNHPGITLLVVYSEKHQSEPFELRAVDKECNLFGAEFCDMKSKLLLGGVVGSGILLKRKCFQQPWFLGLNVSFQTDQPSVPSRKSSWFLNWWSRWTQVMPFPLLMLWKYPNSLKDVPTE